MDRLKGYSWHWTAQDITLSGCTEAKSLWPEKKCCYHKNAKVIEHPTIHSAFIDLLHAVQEHGL